MSGESIVNFPKNLTFEFPLSICEDCELCDLKIDTIHADNFFGDKYDAHYISCEHLETCRSAYSQAVKDCTKK